MSQKLYSVLPHTLPTGERLPILINNNTGIPPILSLRYVLSRRSKGGSARLTSLLRGISDLYGWCESVANINLEELLSSDQWISLRLLERALTDLNNVNCSRRHKELADNTSANLHGSARSHNARIRAWEDFLLWALYPKNYQSDYQPENDLKNKSDRKGRRVDIELFFLDARKPEPASVHHSGLTLEELDAITEAIGPDELGNFSGSGFSEATRLRNWVMYSLTRWGGIRRGELLKLKVGDIPQCACNDVTIQKVYPNHEIQIVRRPDDPEDPRNSRTPSVKRNNRSVVLPETLLDDVSLYIEHRKSVGVVTEYLIVSEDGSPLSIERADGIIKQIGRYAATAYEKRYPGRPHSLFKLSWHRLRHTRAKELLPEFLEAGPIGLDAFLEFFGWASLESAAPYVREFYRDCAATKIHDINTRLMGS